MNVAVKERDTTTRETTTPTVPGVKLLEAKQARLQRRLVLVVTIVPFLGFLARRLLLHGSRSDSRIPSALHTQELRGEALVP